MIKDQFYARLKFYIWLSTKDDNQKFIDYSRNENIDSSTLARWKAKFKKESLLKIMSSSITLPTVRQAILKAIEEKALAGDIQAAKLILGESEEGAENEGGITADQAIRFIRECLQGQ
jgi:hypothetical protein